ncbi:MAG: DUF1611 domain-containing protein [Bacteroidetes bacterium]|nr:DUF1611 domain-containing protein [Bacteroidota bacterium]
MKDTKAIVYCEGAFNTTNGKTAHGLVRFTERYDVLSVIDSNYEGLDAGQVLDRKPSGIPITGSIGESLQLAEKAQQIATHLVIGIAPDGGRLSPEARKDVMKAIRNGLNIDAGLHDYLSEDPHIVKAALKFNVTIRDIRKPPPVSELHFFTGEIEKVDCLKIAVLGTDSAVGKRTTAWRIVMGFRNAGYKAELIGTGQTAWLQGAKYSIIMDSIVNDFVSGEIEHAVVSCWNHEAPDVIVIEGQGSLMNPAYPGGFEILAAGRPDIVIMQHAPARLEYDGFPGYKLHPLDHQIRAIELILGKKVVAVTVNHENMAEFEIDAACEKIETTYGLPATDVLFHGPEKITKILLPYLKSSKP